MCYTGCQRRLVASSVCVSSGEWSCGEWELRRQRCLGEDCELRDWELREHEIIVVKLLRAYGGCLGASRR